MRRLAHSAHQAPGTVKVAGTAAPADVTEVASCLPTILPHYQSPCERVLAHGHGGREGLSAEVEIIGDERRAFFTPETLAAYLSLSGRTIRDMLKRGEIPSYKIRGARRIDPDDVDRYLAKHRQDAA